MFVSKDAKNAIIEYKWIENTGLTLTSPPIIYLDYTYDFLGMENFFAAFNRPRRLRENEEKQSTKISLFLLARLRRPRFD